MALPTYVASGAVANLTAAGAVSLPAGIQTDDILLLEIETANQAVTVSNQNGGTWAEVTDSPQGTGTAAGTTATRLTVFWSRYNGTQGNPTISDSGDHQGARIHAFRGCKTSGDPWNVTAGNVASSSTTAVSIPGDTTTVNNCLIVLMCSLMDDAQDFGATWTNASLANITVRQNSSGAAGNDWRHICVTGEKATAGAYSATTNTLTAASVQGRMSIALEGAADVFSGSGATSVTAPAIAAAGLLVFVGSAALGVTAPGISGTGALIEARTGEAALAVTAPAIASTGTLVFTGSGALLVTPPAIDSSGTQFFNVDATGALSVTAPSIAGTGSITQASVSGSGALSVTAPSISASGSLSFDGTASLSVTAPSLDATGALSFDATGALGVSTSISGAGLETFAGTGAITVPPPVIQGGEEGITGGVVAVHSATVAIVDEDSGTSTLVKHHGTSVMDSYSCDNDTGTCDSTHHTADDAPMVS